MCAAEARRQASTIISSSIRLIVGRRAGGLHDEHVAPAHVFHDLDVDLAIAETADRSARPTGSLQMTRDVMRQRRIGIAGEQRQLSRIHDRLPSPIMSSCAMAGVEGFEPPYGGIKTRCLTTWRHPSRFQSAIPTPACRAAASDPGRARRNCSSDPELARAIRSRILLASKLAKMQAPVPVSRARDRRVARIDLRSQPIERLRHLGVARTHDRLAIVAGVCLPKRRVL